VTACIDATIKNDILPNLKITINSCNRPSWLIETQTDAVLLRLFRFQTTTFDLTIPRRPAFMMAPGIDMSDKNAWDDSFLQDSWNDAVAEYEVGLPRQLGYHVFHLLIHV
jgi:hypothetical protein